MVRYHEAYLPPMTHALHYGTACFEGIRAYWNAAHEQLYVLQAEPHYARLRRSAAILRLDVPHSNQELVDLTLEILRRNQSRTDTYIRPLVFISEEEIGVRLHGLKRSFLIYTAPMGEYIDTQGGIRCATSSWRRVADSAIPARAKITGAYVNSALAKSEALENGFDEAIMLTHDGHVSEGSAENLFMVRDGVFVTPSVTEDILEGITRALLMGLIRDELGLPVVERSIDRTELYACDELFLCGTGAQVSAVVEVDRRKIGNGAVGTLTRRLQEIYFRAVRGEEPRYRDWLTPVYG
ncbi:MAG: branched-chain amino acid transaminase [Chloroflexi bacterium]|nr:branched-chain amino acid transaminase [Chloroflexota bacterium]MBV9600624.1 branched-chain amino acid transaminase [Chloroflexota bacterium]